MIAILLDKLKELFAKRPGGYIYNPLIIPPNYSDAFAER
jgi:hypothetical protein